MKIIAHRGASGWAPENTLAAFQKALDIGVDAIEIDVRPTRDQRIVVFHDKNLNRTTPLRGRVRRRYLAELQGTDASDWFGRPDYFGETIPTLDQTLELLNGQCELLIEIKSEGRLIKAPFLRRLFELIDHYQAHEWVILQSFDTRVLRNIHRLRPDLRLQKLIVLKVPLIGLQFDKTVMLENILKTPYYESINMDHRFVTPPLIRKIHRHRKKICCWTVNNPIRMRQLQKKGVDGIITNYPDRLKRVIR
ncbi:hypothetical protein KFE98_02385 [bacterium SCSIO 12741]|nr:hypothetical protein KFE98_02385 [bacterium SCSIO 12741]